MTTLLVGGALANKAGSGGEAWVRMSWVRGLEQLGFTVRFVEQIEAPTADAIAWFEQTIAAFGLSGRATLVTTTPDGDVESLVGAPDLFDVAADAAALVNISGHVRLPQVLRAVRTRAYVDIDPGFTQIWAEQGTGDLGLTHHDVHFTIGEHIGTAACPIPTNGLRWRHVRQPVVLDDWEVAPLVPTRGFTTVANWRGPYGPIEWEGRRFGVKAHEFRRVLELPARVDAEFEVALAIHPADASDRDALVANGWSLLDPAAVASDAGQFRDYVHSSTAEFSVAQGVYADTNSGWFSDRTIRYLASGRPALVQETGFSDVLPVGDGLVAFRDLDSAADGARRILADIDGHSRAARQIAATCFAADVVLPPFVDALGVCP